MDEQSFIGALHMPSTLLPIARHKEALMYTVENYAVLILTGQTGSGKSTQLPQYLREAGWANDGKIIAVTQPRRVAAATIASRVAEESRCQLGQEVGYSVRFEDVTSASTQIKYLTDGLLLQEALLDPLLSRYSIVMVDEAHERSLSTDALLGLLKKILKRRPDLRIIISSATLQAEDFLRFFAGDSAKIVSIEGRAFPVDIHFTSDPCENYLQQAVNTVLNIHKSESSGDILVFLTGREEIDSMMQMLQNELLTIHDSPDSLLLLPLYAGLTAEEQMSVFEPAPQNQRKVICSTNVAEASVTIDGIVYVIDCGFVKLRTYNPGDGMDSLAVTPVSKASANQRAGRAGRTKAGKCYRLYTESSFRDLAEATIPEIQRSNLAPLILFLKSIGIDNVARFDFFTPPPAELLIRGLELLFTLGALDEYAKLTKPLGVRMADLSLDPMLSSCLLSSPKFGCVSEFLSIAAMTSLGGSFALEHSSKKLEEIGRRKFAAEEGDHLTLLNIYQGFTASGVMDSKWCHQNHFNFKALTRAVSIRNQLRRHLERFGIDVTERQCANEEQIRRCLTTGYFSQAARMQPDGSFRAVGVQKVLYAHPSSLMFNRKADWVIFTEVVESGTKTFIRDLTCIQKGWLLEYAPDYYRVKS